MPFLEAGREIIGAYREIEVTICVQLDVPLHEPLVRHLVDRFRCFDKQVVLFELQFTDKILLDVASSRPYGEC